MLSAVLVLTPSLELFLDLTTEIDIGNVAFSFFFFVNKKQDGP